MRIKLSRIRAVLVALTLTLGSLGGLAVAAPAQAAPIPVGFQTNGIYKFKTTWGGGYVLNTGGEFGSYAAGEPVQVHWNRNWDNNNRWIAINPYHEGRTWVMFRNKHSGLCLFAPGGSGIVQQQGCDPSGTGFYWAFETVAAGADTGRMFNLTHQRAFQDWGLTQNSAHLFSQVRVGAGSSWDVNYWAYKRCGELGFEELKSC